MRRIMEKYRQFAVISKIWLGILQKKIFLQFSLNLTPENMKNDENIPSQQI